jgi:hypothetical protein
MDQRDKRRKKIRLLVQAEPGSIRAFTADVSAGGLFLVSTKVLKPGTRIRLLVRGGEEIALGVGVVRWAKRVPPHLIRTTRGGMGIEFTWVSPELRKVLDDTLAEPCD